MMLTISQAIAHFLDHRRGRGLAPLSLSLYEHWLTFWHTWHIGQGRPLDLASIGAEDFRAFLLYLSEEHVPHQDNHRRPAVPQIGLSPASIDGAWRILSAFWRFLDEEGVLTQEQARAFQRTRVPRPKVPQHIRPTYESEVLSALLDANDCRGPEEAARNRAILLILYESGMRVAEICSLRDEDVWIEDRRARVTGKGDKERWVFWGPRGAHALADYLGLRSGLPDGPLFRSFGGQGMRNMGGPMSPDGVRHLLKVLAEQARVRLPKGAPVHALRHTFAHKALDPGIDALHLQQLLGHSDLDTTTRYVRENPGRLRKIHSRIWEPKPKQELDDWSLDP